MMGTSRSRTGDRIADKAAGPASAGAGATVWSAHLPATRARLSMILERAMHGERDFTIGERMLVFACEYWVLAMGRGLHRHTDHAATAKLRCAAIVFEAIGANDVAAALTAAHEDLLYPHTARQRRLKLLEYQLRVSADLVDALLAQFADNLATAASCAQARRRTARASTTAVLH